MKTTINAAIIRNRYNMLADDATHEKSILLSLLIHCNIPYHLHDGCLVLDSKKGIKLADVQSYYNQYHDVELLELLIESDIWYKVSEGKLTYTDSHNEKSVADKKVACKTKAEKKGEHTMKNLAEYKPMEYTLSDGELMDLFYKVDREIYDLLVVNAWDAEKKKNYDTAEYYTELAAKKRDYQSYLVDILWTRGYYFCSEGFINTKEGESC